MDGNRAGRVLPTLTFSDLELEGTRETSKPRGRRWRWVVCVPLRECRLRSTEVAGVPGPYRQVLDVQRLVCSGVGTYHIQTP